MGLQFKHITSTATFNTTKFSASSGDNTYFTGADPNTQVAGTPDILYKDLVFCKCNGKIYTHGKFYDENGTDGFYSYLSRFSYYGIIISGCNVYRIQTSSSHPWYSRNRGMVFVRGTGIVSVDSSYATTQMDDPNVQDSIWKDNRLGTYHFSAADSAPTEDCVKILDWSDLARLSDLEVPMATEYRSGLMSAEDKGKLSGVKKITGEWLSISNFNGIGYITVRKPVIPDGKILIRYDCEIKNATIMLAVMNPCDCLTETTSGYSTAYIRYVLYADVVCSFDFRPTAIYL